MRTTTGSSATSATALVGEDTYSIGVGQMALPGVGQCAALVGEDTYSIGVGQMALPGVGQCAALVGEDTYSIGVGQMALPGVGQCAALVGEDTYSMYDGLCDACHAAMYFTCDACGEEFHLDEMSAEFPKFCVDCGCEKHRQIVEELNDRLTEVIGSWDGEETEIGRLRKLLSYAKRLK